MLSTSEAIRTLDEDKTRRIIELYLRARFKARFDPAWLDTMDNYAPLATALRFFDKLGNDNLKLAAIGSSNATTRDDHKEQFAILQNILDDVVPLTDGIPPVAEEFNEKKAILWSLELNQHLESRSLRDLHAQNSNLGIVEKLLNGDLGQEEWLGEVDLERMLIKLGVKDRTHITRLNAEDIGMILHFERIKHGSSTAPYTIPLLINCGSSSLRSQGSHWTYAMVSVNPTTNSVTINYHDSMPLRGSERDVLTAAINYSDGPYRAFPSYATQTVNTTSSGQQRDGWSCGYRALKGLITSHGFPVMPGNVNQGATWLKLTNAANTSTALRDVVYDELLDGVEIDNQYAEEMELEPSMITSTSEKSLKLDSKFTQHYRELLGHGTTRLGASENFAEEYRKISILLKTIRVSTGRTSALKDLKQGLNEVITNNELSSDEKLFAILDVMGTEYSKIIKSFGGANSELGSYIKGFCDKHMGVVLGEDPLYRFKKDGLMSRMLDNQTGIKSEKRETESLLPPVKKKTTGTGVSHSAPTIRTTEIVESRVTPSEGSIDKKGARINQPALREHEKDARIGTMFGLSQFCYGQKPSGVEPGFRAIDLNEEFFKELTKILAKIPSDDPHNLARLGANLGKVDDLKRKQEIFALFINAHTPKPYGESTVLSPGIQWLCKEIKDAVGNNHNLQAWMYKLDYAEGQKERIKANKEAIREFVGTRLAGIFSEQNQKQELAWVNNKDGGAHALLACGWKNGLRELTEFLCNGKEPDYRGVLVENKDAPIKRSMLIPGLAKNLIFGVAIGDRDGIGKNAQNKGFADGAFYGFDYGKPYEGDGVCNSLKDDFSFDDFYAKAPEFLRRETKVGVARHRMYRNYSVFYDTPLSERMVGLHLLRKMITGENPDEEVIKSYPGLRQELHRIQENTPTPKALLKQLDLIRHNCSNPKTMALLEAHITDVGSGKLSNFDLYFYKIKTDIMEMAVKSDMSYEELADYIKFIDKMAEQAHTNNARILQTFAQRIPLTRQELDLLEHIEKVCSPTSIMSPDGEIFLNRLRFEPQKGRIPFQLKHEDNGTYTLSTTNKNITKMLEKELGLARPNVSKGGVSYTLSQEQLSKLMVIVEQKYNEKVQEQLVQPTYKATVLKRALSMINIDNTPETPRAGFAIKWEPNGVLSIRLEAKTAEQAEEINKIFSLRLALNKPEILNINPESLPKLRAKIDLIYTRDDYESRSSLKSSVEDVGIELSSIMKKPSDSGSEKWKALHQKEHVLTPTEQLMKRFETLVTKTEVVAQIRDILVEAHPDVVERLLQYNDKTLSNEDNLKAIIQDRLGDIKEISDEIVITPTTSTDVRPGMQ
ncbi:hypothetical protein [Legionella saoudiensis]|uniref:hypothetical protein n=1 Tax=Legionella saoudiensis TaxID=1750561 RepID=UPI0007310619|nr:hypothetical protein [Legionella saoudiensis]